MIPFIRSINELMVITQSRDQRTKSSGNLNFNSITEDSGQRKRYLRSRIEKHRFTKYTEKHKEKKMDKK